MIYQTVQAHMRDDSKFEEEVHLAEMLANEEVEDALRQAALSGNVTAIQVWLYNRYPEMWKDQRNRVSIETKSGGDTIIGVEGGVQNVFLTAPDKVVLDAMEAIERAKEEAQLQITEDKVIDVEVVPEDKGDE